MKHTAETEEECLNDGVEDNMDKEYRIRAYFKELYDARSYKGKIFTNREEAEKMLPEAVEYYNSPQYYGRTDRVVIEERTVSEWK